MIEDQAEGEQVSRGDSPPNQTDLNSRAACVLAGFRLLETGPGTCLGASRGEGQDPASWEASFV